MKVIDATPPADFPPLVIMMDKDLGKRLPKKAFYLRVASPDGGARHVDLDDAVTPLDARKIARAAGYEPTHWMEVGDRSPTSFF